MTGRKFYITHTLFFFCVGLLIFFFGHGWAREFLGDVVAVAFLYFFAQTIYCARSWKIAIVVFYFSLVIEFLQYFQAIHWSGFFEEMFLGNTFDPLDIVAYVFGVIGVWLYDTHHIRGRRTFYSN